MADTVPTNASRRIRQACKTMIGRRKGQQRPRPVNSGWGPWSRRHFV